jgi:hypothetical protein
MLSKEQVIKSIQELPNSFSIEELFDKIIFLEKIEKADNSLERVKPSPLLKPGNDLSNGYNPMDGATYSFPIFPMSLALCPTFCKQ